MLKELDAHVAKGEADDLIVQDFVQEYGEKVLSAPPAHGFNAIAWYIPGVAFAIGLGHRCDADPLVAAARRGAAGDGCSSAPSVAADVRHPNFATFNWSARASKPTARRRNRE